jgi:RHS repeat-associated protein
MAAPWFARFLAAFTNPFKNSAKRSRRRAQRPRFRGFRPMVEMLEDRTLLSTVNYIGPNNGDWDTAANWQDQTDLSNHVPTASDDAVINTAVNVLHATTATDSANSLSLASGATFNLSAGSLTLPTFSVATGATLKLSGGTLTLSTAGVSSEIDGTLNMAGGTLTGSGNVDIGSPTNSSLTGSMLWSGVSSMTGAGITTIHSGSGLTINATANFDTGRSLNNDGAINWSAGNITISHGASLTNQADGTFNDEVASAGWGIYNAFGGTPASFTNAGTFNAIGTVAYSSYIAVPFSSTGSVTVTSGTLNLQGGGSASGVFTVGGTLDFTQTAFTLAAASSVTGIGTVRFYGNDATTVAGTYNASATTIGTGEVDFNSPATTQYLNFGGGTLGGSGTFTFNGGSWTGGTMTGTGTTIVAASSRLTIGPGTVNIDNGRLLNNYGRINWLGGNLTISRGASFTNENGASFYDDRGGNIYNLLGGSVASFNNAGSYIKEAVASNGNTAIQVPFANTGSVDVQESTLSLQGGGSASGKFVVESTATYGAATLDFQQQPYSLAASSAITGAGKVSFGASNLTTIAGAYSVGATSISSGEVDFNSAASTGTLTMTSGILGGTGIFTITSGVSTWSGGTMQGAGTTVLQHGASLNITLAVNLDSGRTLDNHGTINWLDRNITISRGASLLNEADGVFNDQTAASRSIFNQYGGTQASFVNAGTYTKTINSTTTTISIPMTNTGVIDIQVGSLTIQSNLTVNGSGIITGQPFGDVAVTGNLTGTTGNAQLYSPLAAVLFNGSGTSTTPQLLEVMSQDLGAVSTGFIHNFAYDQLTLAAGTYVKLVDNARNSPNSGTSPEALYVNGLLVPAGSTLNLNGLHVYARQAQLIGAILNGTVTVIPSVAGPIQLAIPAPGNLTTTSQIDDWTFFGRAGQSITVVVNTGAASSLPPLQPYLNFAQVSLLDSSSTVLGSAQNTTSGADVSLLGIALAADGVYHVQVQGVSGSTGNYRVTVLDGTTQTRPLNFNETETGQIFNPFQVHQWTFTAAANQNVQFNLVNVSNPAIKFDLTGPSGYVAFSGQTTSSGVITLPTSGNYVLKAYSTQGQTASYAFHMDNITITPLTLGTGSALNFAVNGQAQFFQVNVPGGQTLTVDVGKGTYVGVELYVKYGAPPTRADYQYLGSSPNQSGDLIVSVPMAAQGTWYILVYSPTYSGFSTLIASTSIFLTGTTPDHYSTLGDATLTLNGGGFDRTTTVSLVSSSGTTYAASGVQYLSPTQLTAKFTAGTVPGGVYSIKATRADSASAQLTKAFTMISGGPLGSAEASIAKIEVGDFLGSNSPATIYISCSNPGDTAVPAPILVLNVTQTHADGSTTSQALLTLDPSLIREGLYSSATLPNGFGHSIQVLGSGKNPGFLQPGESVLVPVYWAGWQNPQDPSLPPYDFSLGILAADNTTTVDWTSLKASMRPPNISAAAWDPIFANLTSRLGTTWGSYLQALDADAAYLGQLGESINDPSKLFAFEIQQAIGFSPVQQQATAIDASVPTPGLALAFDRSFANSIIGRYQTGPLGYGWFSSWQTTLSVGSDGTVTINGAAGGARIFVPDTRGGYFDSPGDHATLTALSGGAYSLRELDGTITAFRSDGKIDYVQDTNGNKVTAGYNVNGQLVSLTHSSGQFLNIAYNAAGLISSITDSDNRTTTYGYDPSNQHLMSVTGFDGRTVNYAYDTSTGTATSNALLSAAYADGTHRYFSFDSQGRLSSTSRDGGAEQVTFNYGPGGLVTATDATASITKFFFNELGMIVKTEDALGRDVQFVFDKNFNMIQATDPLGQVYSNQYDANGNLIASTDPAGHTITFTYTGPFNQLSSYTDPKGNTTTYSYGNTGNLLTITYPNGSIDQFSYDPLGNLIDSIDRKGQATQSTYNTNGQVTRNTYADGSHTDYTYDANGNLITAVVTSPSAKTATTTLSYDPITQDLIQITYPDGRFLKFTYDAGGRRIKSVDQDGFTVNYLYDAAGRLAGLTDGTNASIVSYVYDAAGRLIEKDLGNGTYTTYQYDLAGEILHLINYGPKPTSTVNSRFDYTYDTLGRVATMTTLDGQWTYTYDPIGQLTRAVFVSNNPAVTPNQDLQYAYDAAGNRTQTIINGVTTAYTTNNLNEYTTVGSTTNLFDPNGNLISSTTGSNTTTYNYNVLNQLIGVNGPAGTWSYQYDVFGNRNVVTQNGQTTQYLIDPFGLGNVVGAYSGATVTHFTYGLGLTSLVNSTGSYYYDFNALGSTVGLTDASGSYVNKYIYLPFGETTTVAAAVANPFTFIGRFGVSADGSALLNMRARNYDPVAGQFTSADPAGLVGGDLNLRRYVSNSPLQFVDPIGLDGFSTNDEAQLGTASLMFPGIALELTYRKLEAARQESESALNNYKSNSSLYSSAEAKQAEWERHLDAEKRVTSLEEKANFLEALCFALIAGKEKSTANASPGAASQSKNLAQQWAQSGYTIVNGKLPAQIPPSINKPATNVASHDPNDKIGLSGYGPQNFVAPGTLLPYRIDFENEATATAPAQQVVVTDQLDSNLDWTTFQFTEVGFGDNILAIPAGAQHYQTTVAMTYNGQTFNVAIELSLNPATGLVTAVYQSIDPKTELPPEVLTGFLPPEDGTGRGTGYFSYTILAKAGLATGTQIRNVALVTFDSNASIATDQVDPHDPSKGVDPNKQDLVTIDAGAPTSSVNALPASSPSSFTLSWSGTDDTGGSGIATYDIYVSDNGGSFTPFLTATTQTSATFKGAFGHTYAFYSVATDNVGNREATPTLAQTSTTTSSFTDTFSGPGPDLGSNWQVPPLPAKFRYTYRRHYGFGGFQVQGGKAVSVGTSFNVEQVTGFSWQNPTLQADVNVSNAQALAAGLMARLQPNGDCYAALLTHDGMAEIVLFQAATNSFTILGSASAGTNVANMQFTVSGNTLSLVCGTASFSVMDSTLSSGGVGMFTWGPNGVIQNFSVSGY